MKKDSKMAFILSLIFVLAVIIYCFFCQNESFDFSKIIEMFALTVTTVLIFCLFKTDKKAINYFISGLLLVVTPFYIVHFILYDRTIKQTENYLIDVLVIAMLMCFVLIFCRKTAIAIISVSAFCMVFIVMNELVIIFRKAAITPTDIFSLGTALAVSGQYEFSFTYKMLISVLSTASISLLAVKFNTYLRVKKAGYNLLIPVIPLAVFCIGLGIIAKTEIKGVDTFDITVSNKNAGTATTFAYGVKTMQVSPPDGYSNKAAEAVLSEFNTDNDIEFTKPNVIVIMNEAFSDLSFFCEISDVEEYMPNITAMKENTRKGFAQVSVFGGNTCNTEFEFLTGATLNFLPSGYIPYMRTLTKRTPSIVKDFSEQGYKTIAIHPYMPQCWRRSSIYPLLGFDSFISGVDFDENHETTSSKMRGSVDFGDLKYIRKYVSDEENYDMVLKQLKNKNPDESAFVFNVTMQNHGPYTYSGNDFNEYIKDFDVGNVSDKEEVIQYLSLIYESDRAFSNFIAQLETFEEPTVVLMFGDHLPGLKAVNDDIAEKQGQYKQDKYNVPYYFWANYDIEESISYETIGMSYLSNDLKKLINMPLNNWDKLREQARAEYPCINAYGAFDTEKNWVEKSKENVSEKSEIMKKYEIAQYGRLFKDIE